MLSNSGYLLISVPMNEGLEEMFPSNPNGHLRCYSEDLLQAELEISGFEVLERKSFFAFRNGYQVKTFLSKLKFVTRWKPNNILILSRKK